MAEYVLTTDSNSDVPAEFLREYEIPVIPQYYMFGETVYGDELNMEPREFYETMRKGELPKSMANNPEVIREKFEKILKEGKDILHVAFSSALSGSCGNVQVVARDLAEEYPDRKIRVFDSLNASLGEGVSVMRAALLRREGKGMEEVLKVLEEERDHVNPGDKDGGIPGSGAVWEGPDGGRDPRGLPGGCKAGGRPGGRAWVYECGDQ